MQSLSDTHDGRLMCIIKRMIDRDGRLQTIATSGSVEALFLHERGRQTRI